MNSITKKGDCIADMCKIKFIHHEFITPRFYDRYWDATIMTNDNAEYNVRIIENVNTNGDKYYTGELYNRNIANKYNNTYLCFGYSNYHNTYRYILEAMLRVIKGDYSEIKGVGHCVAKPS